MWSAIESLTKAQEIVIRMQQQLDTKLDKVLRSVRASDTCQKPPTWPNELPLQSMTNLYKFENSLNETEFMEFAVSERCSCTEIYSIIEIKIELITVCV